MQKYDHQQVEKKWQKFWEENAVFKVDADESKPKYYILDMFPYPSGAGLHVGHAVGYTATDVIARYKRMQGYNVLHPMGWDSFGLPAEQYAIRTGIHPSISTEKNIETYRKQLKSFGFSYDWSREVATSDPRYYKWTQWIFTELYKKGLAYEAEMLVNFCPELGTVLSNEEVDEGKSKEGGFPVIRKPLKQWILKITEYAERLLEDLEELDWPEHIKALQRNWIGKSPGAMIEFDLEKRKERVVVFTTRQDTLMGATFVVLAPEHPLVDLITEDSHREQVASYRKETAKKSDLERTELTKDKTGVFTGGYVLHPVTREKLPVWIADYVLGNYGYGAVMAVPSHDDRDFAFAQKYALPMKQVITPTKENLEEGVNYEEIVEKFQKNECAWPYSGILVNSTFSDLLLDGVPSEEANRIINKWLEKNKHGKEEIHYKLRDWLFSRQRYWGEPIPIVHLENETIRVLDKDELPLCPPSMQDFKPSDDGRSPLAKDLSWVNVHDQKSGKKGSRETNTMPQWAGSCWYYLRFCDPTNDLEAWSQRKERYWLPVDLYIGGVEHAVLHLLYARFWHKVLFDLGHVSTKEPFWCLRNQGLVMARSFKTPSNRYVPYEEVIEKDGIYTHRDTKEVLTTQVEKMSKSKLNGISPDEVIENQGGDALRAAVLFMGPLEKEKIWTPESITGVKRFLLRVYDICTTCTLTDTEDEATTRLQHRLLASVQESIQHLHFNTAIARMMEFINEITQYKEIPRPVMRSFLQMLSLFAPHLAEELWSILGFKELLVTSSLDTVDPKYLQDETVTYVVQVNGKLRGRFDLPLNSEEETIVRLAKEHEHISKFIQGKVIKKVIFVPNKLLNFVVE